MFNSTVSSALDVPEPQDDTQISEGIHHRVRPLPKRLFHPDITDGAFRMYVYVSLMADANIRVSRKSIAEFMCVSTRTIFTRELNLVAADLLTIEPQYSGNVRIRSDYYLKNGDES